MKKLSLLLIIFSFFPFVSFINLGTDIQPYAFILSVVIIFINKSHKIPKKLLSVLVVSVFSVFVLFLDERFGFLQIRSVYNYVSLGVISYASYLAFNKINYINEKVMKILINSWFLIGLIQKFLYPGFLMFLVAGDRTSLTRGITNLTSEPSFYGYMLMFAMLFALDFREKRNFYVINLIIQLLFFSQSAIGIVYIVIYIGLMLIKYLLSLKPKNFIRVTTIILVAVVFGSIFLNLYPNSRASTLLYRLVQNPDSVYISDQSVNARFNHIYNPVVYSIKHFLLPNGYSKADRIFYYKRIMSGYGAAIFELGFMGLILIIGIFNIIYSTKTHQNHRINGIFITIIMFSAIQIANPMLPLYLGYLLNLQKINRTKNNRSDFNNTNYLSTGGG